MFRKKRRKAEREWTYGWWQRPDMSREELLERIKPLLRQLRKIDAIILKTIQGKGTVQDVLDIGTTLGERFSIGRSPLDKLTLAQFPSVRTRLDTLKQGLHLELHTVDGQYPAYLLCRVSTDWDAPDIILEELYVSQARNDFFPDERFTVLMRNGRSKTFLRLSVFRKLVLEWLTTEWGETPDSDTCDQVLETVGTLVLAAAWYEDQQLPFRVADVFDLKQFRMALELVGFVLGSDLYQVATRLREDGDYVLGFFTQVYRNKPLARLLHRQKEGRIREMAALEESSREAFVELNRLFSDFLGTTGALNDLETVELFRVVLGCFDNLSEVADHAHWTASLQDAVKNLDKCSGNLLHHLLLS